MDYQQEQQFAQEKKMVTRKKDGKRVRNHALGYWLIGPG